MQNLVILASNVGATPEVRTIQGGTKITNFSLATSRSKRDQDGKTVAQHVEKGQMLMVRGRIHSSSQTDNENIQRYGAEIIADEVTFLFCGENRQERHGAAQDDEADDAPS